MNLIETERLTLRFLTVDDAAFLLELVNDEAWLRHIGDRGLRTVADACAYVCGPAAALTHDGLGLYVVRRKIDEVPVGLCSLLLRETLPDVDLGFALLPQFRGGGIAREAAEATLRYARVQLGRKKLVAITSPENAPSIRLLERLGFRFERRVRLAPDKPELNLFGSDA